MRSLVRVAAPLAGVAALVSVGTPSASAGVPRPPAPAAHARWQVTVGHESLAPAAHARWRITAGTGRAALFDVDANRRGDAWAAGFQCPGGRSCDQPRLRVEVFNGRAWRILPTPHGLPARAVDVTVAAGSPADGWLFATNLSAVRAFHWNGRRWAGQTLPGASAISAADVFGPRSMWVFGLADQKGFAARYDGHSWRRVNLPAAVYYQQALSSRDIWAAGPTAATQTLPPARQVWVVMHWNGRAWRTIRLPAVRLQRHGYLAVYGLAASGRRNVWLDCSTGSGGSQGATLLHWTGAWRQVRVVYSATTYAVQRMVPDARGGLWLAALGGRGPFTQFLYHYARGHWSRQRPPAVRGTTTSLRDLSWIPGTGAVWAVGVSDPVGHRQAGHGVILKYGR